MRTLYRGGSVHSPEDPFASALITDGATVAWVGSDEAADAHAAPSTTSSSSRARWSRPRSSTRTCTSPRPGSRSAGSTSGRRARWGRSSAPSSGPRAPEVAARCWRTAGTSATSPRGARRLARSSTGRPPAARSTSRGWTRTRRSSPAPSPRRRVPVTTPAGPRTGGSSATRTTPSELSRARVSPLDQRTRAADGAAGGGGRGDRVRSRGLGPAHRARGGPRWSRSRASPGTGRPRGRAAARGRAVPGPAGRRRGAGPRGRRAPRGPAGGPGRRPQRRRGGGLADGLVPPAVRRRPRHERPHLPLGRAGPRPRRRLHGGRAAGRLPRDRRRRARRRPRGVPARGRAGRHRRRPGGGHRLEHVETPDADAVARLADLGLTASVQPAFDAAWGGPERDVRAAAGPRAGGRHEPVRVARRGRRAARLRVGQPR